MGFFENLNFSSSNEDGESELKALAGAARVLCLTGSGTRPLDMLMSEAEEVIALDVNPAQNALLALKMAAIEVLDHAEFLAFIGVTDGERRLETYGRLRDRLRPEERGHWDRHQRMLQSGIWYAGKWERLLIWNARFLNLFRSGAIDALMSAPNVEAQARIWAENFGDSRLRRAIEMIGRDWIWRWVMREPAGEFLPPPREVAARLAADFERAAGTFLFRESDFATLILLGVLDPKNYARMQSRLPRLRILRGGLAELGRLGLRNVTGFSLSDFGSYTGPAVYAACWRGILAAAVPGAAYCERIFMNDLPLPFPEICEDVEASTRLTRADRAIIYHLRVGTIADVQV
jgi:S-adenosylmethionine-diacylglycerol 3-amino-3-carboxypropyl transferase